MSTKNLILKALRENNHGYLSGETLSNHLDISRTAVWKAIKALREEGYIIQAVTNKGYKLIEEDGIITEENLRAFLPANYKNNDIHIYDTLDSMALVLQVKSVVPIKEMVSINLANRPLNM